MGKDRDEGKKMGAQISEHPLSYVDVCLILLSLAPTLQGWGDSRRGYCASTTVHPSGMPLSPVVHLFVDLALVNVPVAATPDSHSVQLLSFTPVVARQVTALRFVQPLNIQL